MPVIDLNSKRQIGHAPAQLREGVARVHRQTHFLASDRSPTHAYISTLRRALSWQPQDQKLLLSGPIPVHGLCTTHLPREPARHRSLPSRPAKQTLSHGHSQQDFMQYLGQSVYVLIAHYQKTSPARCQSLHNSTDFECHHLRENTVVSNTYRCRLHNANLRRP